MLKFLFICIEVLVLFNLMIVVHELGHYLAARWRGLVIERFGIWFGKPIFKRRIDGVDFCLGCIPAGGYVALPQMAPMESIEGKNEAKREQLPAISPLDKIIVAFAGPLFSLGLAVFFAFVVWAVGRPVSEKETTTTIGYVVKDAPADKAGLKPGDKILEVDGHAVEKWGGVGESVTWRILRSEGETIPILIERAGQKLTVNPTPVRQQTKAWERRGLRQIGIEGAFTPMIAKVTPGGPADRAGFKPSDLLLSVNGQKLISTGTLREYIQSHPGETLRIERRRGDSVAEVSVRPEVPISGEKVPLIGIEWDDTGIMTLTHPNPIEQVRASVNSMVSTFGALFSRKSDIGPQHLSGPLGILRIYYILFESEHGWRLALWFSVLLNVNLALLNLLPIPVLDGGHITMALIEAVRRKPMNVRLLNWVQTACAVLVIGYILYVSFYDAQDFGSKGGGAERPEIKFAPPGASPAPSSTPVPAAP